MLATPPSTAELVKTVFSRSSNTALSANQFKACADTIAAYDNGLGIHSAVITGNSQAHSPVEYPSGFAINFPPGATVNPITLGPDAFQVVVLCKIIPDKDQTLTDDYFAPRLEQLNAAVDQYASTPISLTTRAENNTDDDLWEAEMGKNGAVGVVKCRRGARSSDYYIYAKCGAEMLGQGVIANLSKTAPTWEEAVRSKEVKKQKQKKQISLLFTPTKCSFCFFLNFFLGHLLEKRCQAQRLPPGTACGRKVGRGHLDH